MRYVIIRDDDTNALTPVECLERLYRPFLERGLPVNLAVIPEVSTAAKMANGTPEGFLLGKHRSSNGANGDPKHSTQAAPQDGAEQGRPSGETVPIGQNSKLVRYLLDNPGYHFVQHGCHHDYLEFDSPSEADITRRLERGSERLAEAGLPQPETFVAPYDKFSRTSFRAVAERFRVISTGWYELRRVPYGWWPQYAVKKIRHAPHWKVGRALLLSHPGCLLSYQRTYSTMLGGILHFLATQRLTVLVTHWWEYFRDGQPDEPFIDFLHETASYLAGDPELKVISFSELVRGDIPLN